MAAGGEKENEEIKNRKRKKGFLLDPKEEGNLPRRSPAIRSGYAIRVSAKDDESYTEILEAMKAKEDPPNTGVEVLFIRSTRREEILQVLKGGGGDVSAFEKAMIRRSGRRPM